MDAPARCGDLTETFFPCRSERQGWFGCACCPPNIARLLASLGKYIYTFRDRTVYAHLYVGGQTEWELEGNRVVLAQDSGYTWEGKVRFRVESERAADFRLALRIPEWTDRADVRINGVPYAFSPEEIVDGYLVVSRVWQPGDALEIEFGMPVRRLKGHPLVRQTAGKIALQRGPFVYCAEEADNGPGLHELYLPEEGRLQAHFDSRLLGGILVIRAEAERRVPADAWGDSLYRLQSHWRMQQTEITLIPYFCWANRGKGEMTVWMKESVKTGSAR